MICPKCKAWDTDCLCPVCGYVNAERKRAERRLFAWTGLVHIIVLLALYWNPAVGMGLYAFAVTASLWRMA